LRRQHDDLVLGVDRLVDLALGLQGSRQLAPRCDALWVLLGLLLRVADRRHSTRASAASEQVADTGASCADAEDHEAAAEGDSEEDEHPLGVASQSGEEHRVLDRRSGRALDAARGRYGSILLRALRAALVESGHPDVPFE